MKTSQGPQGKSEVDPPSQASHESLHDQQNNPGTDASMVDSTSISVSSNDNNKKVSREDIELVQNLIERCLLMYMNRSEVVRILLNRARIEPGFTTLVWQKLEEENAEFFRAYYIRLKLKKQIFLFNNLLEHQYHLMKYPVPPKVPMAPMQNGVHPIPANNLPMGYPILQQPTMPSPGQPHLDSMRLPNCHVVNGFPAPGNFHPVRVNSVNGDMMEDTATDVVPAVPPGNAMSSMSEMAVSPTSVASSGHFPFAPADISGMGIDSSVLDSAFTSDVGTTGDLQLGFDGEGSSKDNLQSGGQLPWTFSLTDLTNLEDLGDLGSCTVSSFLTENDIMIDTDQDDIVEDYFVDNINGPCLQSDEDK
uniref:Trans-splicing factor Raa3, chloroplastic n=1 Tax=Anthurium amnicola TaxID=1678845 RepID=A0A1D1Z463_9ARAE